MRRDGDAAADESSVDQGISGGVVYTVEQVAEILQIGRDKVYMLLRTGRLRSIKIGRLRRITDRQLADFIASVEDVR
ncbi:helix-turn-helix domain-containing protein [Actinomadura latina]|uniref:Helix-turn-helix domain-containing protein n=2 Tax=Actinomadura latina TaxID=163603 RepID=A0A846YYZ4_9ACTN|nr:helix-turn-helix domain-containing protein [Actinomadura latina]